jgi:dCMP deaminase
MSKRQKKWDRRFLGLSEHISRWSKDPSTKVGAIITNDIKIVSVGFNGLPQSTKDYPEILENRGLKYKHIIHAETNAILAAKTDLTGCTIYTFPFLPCTRCASMVAQSGISRVVSIVCQNKRWEKTLQESKHFMGLCGLEVVEYEAF